MQESEHKVYFSNTTKNKDLILIGTLRMFKETKNGQCMPKIVPSRNTIWRRVILKAFFSSNDNEKQKIECRKNNKTLLKSSKMRTEITSKIEYCTWKKYTKRCLTSQKCLELNFSKI